MNIHTFFATAPRGIEPLLATELESLGATAVHSRRGGVTFQGTLSVAYRACLWSRTASRILMPLASFPAPSPETLYAGTLVIPWEEHLSADGTLAVDLNTTGSQIRHSRFGVQKIKDAIVDRFRQRYGRRPSVDRHTPDVRINGYLLDDQLTISLDLSGDSLHRRGYRVETVPAPLKENLAAALLIKAGWPEIAAARGGLMDPLCGSGTLVIEAALMAAHIAPGLGRDYWGFLGWLQHTPELWQQLLAEAHERRQQGLGDLPFIAGSDQDPRAVRAAIINASRAGLEKRVHFQQRMLDRVEPSRPGEPGLLVANPPYGERLGEVQELGSLYGQLGHVLKSRFSGWQAAVFTANPDLGKNMGLRAQRTNVFYNGALPCKLLRFQVEPPFFVDREAADARKRKRLLASATPFANRLRKNLRTVGAWARRQGIGCYRLYAADIPEYAVAIDIYDQWLHVQEYAPPKSVQPEQARERLAQMMVVLPDVLEIPPERIVLKVRERKGRTDQYRKQADGGRFLEVQENQCRFLVNLTDHLDTGLFLDHRDTRRMLGELACGRHFLNLFAYTGTATVYAALNAAESTTSVDLSRTYLDWARRNLDLNGIQGRHHRLIQSDCLEWLRRDQGSYDLIFLDPPTFSNSKRMQGNFDIQRDHVTLIHLAMAKLAPGGVLIFANNYQRFRLDGKALADVSIRDITDRTIPRDFQRKPDIHHCWRIVQR